MNQVSRVKKIKILFLACLAFVLVVSLLITDPKTEAVSSSASDEMDYDADQAAQQPKAQEQKPREKQGKKEMLGVEKGKALAGSAGCVVWHINSESMHLDGDDELGISCIDCHGGNAREFTDKDKAHVLPSPDGVFKVGKTANVERVSADWLKESDEYIRFINPGDFRSADRSCGECHGREVAWMKKSMMTHGGMLWGAALYNNGAYPLKDAHFGESYGKNGQTMMVRTKPSPTPEETMLKGILPFLMPLPRWEI